MEPGDSNVPVNPQHDHDLESPTRVHPSTREKPPAPPGVSIFDRLHIHHPLVKFKTEFCQHEFGCIENVLRGFAKSFTLGYLIKMGIRIIGVLISFKKLMKKPSMMLKALVNKDNVRFGAFLGAFTGILKSTICLLRIIRKNDDGSNFFAAGALAGFLSLFIQPKSDRTVWGTFLIARAFDCVYNHLVLNGTIKKSPFHYVFLFALLNSFTGYAFGHEPYLLPRSLEKFYLQMTNMHDNDRIMRSIWIERTRRELQAKGYVN
jgi:hypothetical protein